MSLSEQMNSKELEINQVKTKPDFIDVILSLFGLSTDKEIGKHFDSDDAKPHVNSELYRTFDAKELDKIPELKLEHQVLTAESKWVLRSNLDIEKTGDEVVDELNKKFAAGTLGNETSEIKERLHFYQENLTNYTQSIQDIIDCIMPDKPHKSLIPITILLPDSDIQNGNELTGKKTNWTLFNIRDKGENTAFKANEFVEIMKNSNICFGLRLFLVFKLLGMVKLKQDDNNLSSVFTDILSSTTLKEQITSTNKDRIEKYKKLVDISNEHKKRKENKKKALSKLSKKKLELGNQLDKTSASKNSNSEKLLKLKSELKKVGDDIAKIMSEIRKIDVQLTKTANDQKRFLTEPTPIANNFYYTLKSDTELIFPSLTSALKTQQFETNKVEYVQKELRSSADNVESIRLALTRLLPYTSGTAITFHIPHLDLEQKISSPLLVLPQQWNEFLLTFKQYDYEEGKVKIKSKKEEVIASRTANINYHINDAKTPLEQPAKYARFFPRIYGSAIVHTVNSGMESTSNAMNEKYPVNKGEPVVIKSGLFNSSKK